MQGDTTSLTGLIQVMKNIDNIYAKKLDNLKKVMNVNAREMLNQFRNIQRGAPEISPGKITRGKNKGKAQRQKPTADEISKANAFAKAHANDTIKTDIGSGIPWINRTHWAERGIQAYVKADSNEIAVGLMHTIAYGAYLEYGRNRKYAIVEPIVRNQMKQVMNDIRGIF